MGLNDDIQGFFTNYTGTVKDAWFGTDSSSKYDPSMLYVFMKLETDDPDYPEHTERYSCGKGWRLEGNGETATLYTQEGDRANKQKFSLRWAEYARFIQKVGVLAQEKGLTEDIDQRVDTKRPSTWAGLTFHFAAVDEGYQPKEGPYKKWGKNYPDVLLWGKNVDSTQNGQGKGQVDEVSVSVVEGLDGDLREKLSMLARKSDSAAGYSDLILMELPELRADGELRAKIETSGVREVLRNG